MNDINGNDSLKKWRLILGDDSDKEGSIQLESEALAIDAALATLYNHNQRGGLGDSSPNVNRWLGDIRKYFPSTMVQIMQKDAMEQLGLKEMLLEPEMLSAVEPNVDLVATILSLNKIMPSQTKSTAREVVKKVVESLEKKLSYKMKEAIQGALNKSIKNRRPRLNEMDWHRTIKANMKHYQKKYQTIIPEQLWGYGKKRNALKEVILLVDQSGSMASSLVYASILGSVLASLQSIKTHMLVFDTNVVDLTKNLNDPVELLFGTQLGGGTDINKALQYATSLINHPNDTILVLISDLYEGGSEIELLQVAKQIKAKGVSFITLLSLDNHGAPSYDKNIATKFHRLDIPTFSCTPDQFPDLMAKAIQKEALSSWITKNKVSS